MEAPRLGVRLLRGTDICSTNPVPIGSSQLSGILIEDLVSLTVSFAAGQREFNQVYREQFSQEEH
jgi:hypothetical protein